MAPVLCAKTIKAIRVMGKDESERFYVESPVKSLYIRVGSTIRKERVGSNGNIHGAKTVMPRKRWRSRKPLRDEVEEDLNKWE
jgi:aldehyde:ferredoxin oxidoreductase